nr:SDR family oxidoreductase [Metabacillus lacus]
MITGASSGIGKSIAELAAQKGADLYLLARREEALQELSASLQAKYGIHCSWYTADVSDTSVLQGVLDRILADSGGIDILVNNAGFGVFRSFEEATLEEMENMFAVNVFGLVACTKGMLPSMQKKGSGHIINIASQAGKIATPKSSLYAATKHAVLGFTNSLRMEVKDAGIYVTAVNPGPIKTEFFDHADKSGQYVKNIERYMLLPQEVAQKVVNAMLTPKREINLPGWMSAGSVAYQLFPGLFERLAGRAFSKK